MSYRYIGIIGGLYTYSFTLKLFQRCQSNRLFPDPAIVSVFNKNGGVRVLDLDVPLRRQENLLLGDINSCITNPPTVCYDVATYDFTISLPATPDGYTIACQVNFRIDGITNLATGTNDVGATYTAEIPGNAISATGPENNSAVFIGDDLVVVCANNSFTYSFAANDPDKDQLRYSFCQAYTNSSPNNDPPSSPPYFSVPYNNSLYSGDDPLGKNVTIDPLTGLIQGVAPAQGIYVVTVCVEEIRNGKVIAVQRKDLQIFIADCNIAAASLLPEYYLCGDSKTLSIPNLSNSPLIETYDWQIQNSSGQILYNSTAALASYTFADTGLYLVKLAINRDEECSDSTSSLVRVYPGFIPDFKSAGYCITKGTSFFDLSTSVYGTVNSWYWTFGENNTNTDFSDQQNPNYTYTEQGTKDPALVVMDSKGCKDTVIKLISILEKPPLLLSFADTLICVNDRLQLNAGGTGVFSWSPAINIVNSNSAAPTVSPTTSLTYYVEMNDNGCINNDSVRVNVVDHVTLNAMADTVICEGDPVTLNINSDGLQYAWTPADQLDDAAVQDPVALTQNTTGYEVIATIGGCNARSTILVTPIPYPKVSAGMDSMICYNTAAQLKGETDGSSWSWSPAASLDDASVKEPVAHPANTTAYYFTATDNKGCPKPVVDTVVINVDPEIDAFAGNDTSVVVGQPLQLMASGGIQYNWSPAEFLSSGNIANPVATFVMPTEKINYKVIVRSAAGCSDSALIAIKVFQSSPIVFVPSAFTPNHDGKNELLRPIAVGIAKIDYFRVFNRWGQVVFSTSTNGAGWDGTISGQPQSNGTYIWMVKASDFNGAPYFQKGTVTIIR